jgi:putative transposase
MSKAGYPYDNAPMERYYNTLKNELIYLHHYHSDEELKTPIYLILLRALKSLFLQD